MTVHNLSSRGIIGAVLLRVGGMSQTTALVLTLGTVVVVSTIGSLVLWFKDRRDDRRDEH